RPELSQSLQSRYHHQLSIAAKCSYLAGDLQRHRTVGTNIGGRRKKRGNLAGQLGRQKCRGRTSWQRYLLLPAASRPRPLRRNKKNGSDALNLRIITTGNGLTVVERLVLIARM